MKRRTVIRGLVGATVLGGTGARLLAAAPSEGEIPRRTFGRTGEKLTVIGLASGRFQMCGSEDAAVALTRRAYELGINYFDTARLYWKGNSERVFGRAMKEFRKKVFLTSKSAERTRAKAEADLAASLAALQTDYLDLWQVHQVGTLEEVEQIFAPGGAIEAFVAAKQAGKCRFIGFTGHRDPEVHLELLKRFDRWDTILMPLHIADPLYLSFEKQVLPIAVARGMGIQGMKNFGNGGLLKEFSVRECLGYVLSLPVHCTALGCTAIPQLEEDVRVARSFEPLDAAQRLALNQRAEGIKGPKLENWKKNTDTRLGLAGQPEYVGG
ncbi:MAG: aldo/keto reductase [Verrucomicrobia bacterium]|nr:aldo/keto reductase [Verrucomicrobiota bacterium]